MKTKYFVIIISLFTIQVTMGTSSLPDIGVLKSESGYILHGIITKQSREFTQGDYKSSAVISVEYGIDIISVVDAIDNNIENIKFVSYTVPNENERVAAYNAGTNIVIISGWDSLEVGKEYILFIESADKQRPFNDDKNHLIKSILVSDDRIQQPDIIYYLGLLRDKKIPNSSYKFEIQNYISELSEGIDVNDYIDLIRLNEIEINSGYSGRSSVIAQESGRPESSK